MKRGEKETKTEAALMQLVEVEDEYGAEQFPPGDSGPGHLKDPKESKWNDFVASDNEDSDGDDKSDEDGRYVLVPPRKQIKRRANDETRATKRLKGQENRDLGLATSPMPRALRGVENANIAPRSSHLPNPAPKSSSIPHSVPRSPYVPNPVERAAQPNISNPIPKRLYPTPHHAPIMQKNVDQEAKVIRKGPPSNRQSKWADFEGNEESDEED
ncbi:hypothetical protein HDU97_000273 [Phlyctochytrium planicorne]|nr:hypothetical protein HDU97_000273 [Phlyctochytrium planicorne]